MSKHSSKFLNACLDEHRDELIEIWNTGEIKRLD